MSNTPLHQEMDINPAPETPSPGPNGLNFTDQVHSLLNGETPTPISPDDNIPGAPVSVLETDSQNGNNSAPDEREAGNDNEDGADTTSSQGGADPAQTPGEAGMSGDNVNRESVQQFFNLDLEQQSATLIKYQQHLAQVLDQNKQMAEMIEKINVERQGLAVQVETALQQNADLIKTIKETPSVESITTQVKDTLDKEYELKFKNLEDQLVREKQVQDEIHKDTLKKQDTHYSGLLKQGLSKMKADYETKIKETLVENESRFQRQQQDHRAQLEALTMELDEWKRRSSTGQTGLAQTAAGPVGEQLGQLKDEIYNFLPGTVKTDRGGAVTNTTINWDNTTLRPKHVTFATSTPKVTEEDMVGLAAPLAAETTRVSKTVTSGSIGDQSTLINLASEFKKMREPKIQKLKGGNTSSAQLFITGWIKEVRAVIRDRNLSDEEGVQLIREFTESKARQQVDFYLDMNPSPTIEGVLEHLISAFSSGEDESSIKSEFYSRKQLARESEDDYAEVLQILARKIMIANPAFQAECNGALIHQFANGLRDEIIRPLAKDLVNRKPGIAFIKFRSEVANLSGSRLKRTLTKVTVNAVEEDEEIDRPNKKTKQERQSLDAQIKTLMEQNRSLSQKVDSLANLQTSNLTEAVSQAVNYTANRFGGQSKSHNQQSSDKARESKPFLGKEFPPRPTKGKDGSLNVAETCNYCKNPGHLLDNCTKLQDRIDRGLAKPLRGPQKQSGK